MSDFDREAERERLREQFEKDKRKREQSERMSELLLKGATMTNKHCDRCGDPIFRWNGQEFCPTCQGGPTGEGAQSAQAQQSEQPPQSADDGQSAETETQQPERPLGEEEPQEPPASNPEAAPEPTDPAQPTRPSPEMSNQRARPSGRPVSSEDASAVAAARASLARTLAALSERAEHADDLATTRQYLTAAKEAAEALDAAERAGR